MSEESMQCPSCGRWFLNTKVKAQHTCANAPSEAPQPSAVTAGYDRLNQLTAPLPSVPRPEGMPLALAQLDQLTEIMEQAELLRAATVRLAREQGESWTRIGQQLGMTKQAAQQRYSAKKPRTVKNDPEQLSILA